MASSWPHRIWSLTRTRRFSALAGIVGPIICLLMDPRLFRSHDEDLPIFGQSWIFFYSFFTVEMTVLAIWLLAQERSRAIAGLIAGALFPGALIALWLGIVILPLTLIGLLFLIGILGFTPFFTAYVYDLQSKQALSVGLAHANRWQVAVLVVLGMTIALGVPAAIHIEVQHAWQSALQDAIDGKPSALPRVHFWNRFLDAGGQYSQVGIAAGNEHHPERQRRLLELEKRIRAE